jgi:hypothetical protein
MAMEAEKVVIEHARAVDFDQTIRSLCLEDGG